MTLNEKKVTQKRVNSGLGKGQKLYLSASDIFAMNQVQKPFSMKSTTLSWNQSIKKCFLLKTAVIALCSQLGDVKIK